MTIHISLNLFNLNHTRDSRSENRHGRNDQLVEFDIIAGSSREQLLKILMKIVKSKSNKNESSKMKF